MSTLQRGLSQGTRTTLVVVAAALILSAAMGIRQTFGLMIVPISVDRGVPITFVALAIALHNLVWGIAQPFAGAAADRFGSLPVIAFGAVAFAAGLAMTAASPSDLAMLTGMGLLVGLGVSCTTFGVILTAVGRRVSPQQRSMAMGLASAGGSLGQVVIVPLSQWIIETSGLAAALCALACLILVAAPFGILLDGRRPPATFSRHEPAGSSLGDALAQALQHRGYRLLTIGFFTCGFQLAFIATHLPAYLTLCHMPISLGATALSLIGLFNMAGSWACGWLGGRFRQQYVLGWLYLIRALAIGAFLIVPTTSASVIIFAAVMGLTWLGTVPLTSGWVAKVFGVQHLGTLFGVCFLSHQLGSFLGAWMGGFVFALTGSYTLIWAATAALGLIASMLHFPITDRTGTPALLGAKA